MIEQVLIDYIKDNLLFEFDDVVTRSDDLFGAGILDSFGYIKMMKFIEDSFSIEFTEEELMKINASFNDLVEKINSKKAEANEQ